LAESHLCPNVASTGEGGPPNGGTDHRESVD
jgi:hypothetical protein